MEGIRNKETAVSHAIDFDACSRVSRVVTAGAGLASRPAAACTARRSATALLAAAAGSALFPSLDSPCTSGSIECFITISPLSTAVVASVGDDQLEGGAEDDDEEEEGDEGKAKSDSDAAAAAAVPDAAHGDRRREKRRREQEEQQAKEMQLGGSNWAGRVSGSPCDHCALRFLTIGLGVLPRLGRCDLLFITKLTHA